MYEDEGDSFGYRNGAFSLKIFETEGKDKAFTLRQRKEGDFVPAYQRIKIYLVGFPLFVKKCLVDGAEIPIKEIRLRDRSLYTLVLSPLFEKIEWEG